ncbi:MAG: hypothetical protein ACE5K1_07645 [Acidiferrobacterales bacterium]
MNVDLSPITSKPVVRWLIYLLFAAVFYRAGETFVIWILEPELFRGGGQWLWILLFPLLVPAFFVVNRRFGCASGSCSGGGRFPEH